MLSTYYLLRVCKYLLDVVVNYAVLHIAARPAVSIGRKIMKKAVTVSKAAETKTELQEHKRLSTRYVRRHTPIGRSV